MPLGAVQNVSYRLLTEVVAGAGNIRKCSFGILGFRNTKKHKKKCKYMNTSRPESFLAEMQACDWFITLSGNAEMWKPQNQGGTEI